MVDFACHALYKRAMQTDTASANLVVRVLPETKAALQQLADADHRTLSDFVRLHLTKLVEAQA